MRVVFDAAGNVIARADYLPFGEELFAPTGPLPAERFTGQARDGEAGLDYFHARQYQPRTGRFNAVDPIYAGLFDPQKWNRYAYARNSPTNLVDPAGLDDCPPGTPPTFDNTFRGRFRDSFWTTNRSIPGTLMPVGAGFLTGPLARRFGGLDVPGQFGAPGWGQLARDTRAAVAGRRVGRQWPSLLHGAQLTKAASLKASVVFGFTLEVGIVLGSLADAAWLHPCAQMKA